MQQNKKQPYLAPAVKVVEVKVERGLQTSMKAGDNLTDIPGTEALGEELDQTNSWYGTF